MLRVYWGFIRNVLRVHWGCIRTFIRGFLNALGVYQECTRSVFRVYWKYIESVQKGMQWNFKWIQNKIQNRRNSDVNSENAPAAWRPALSGKLICMSESRCGKQEIYSVHMEKIHVGLFYMHQISYVPGSRIYYRLKRRIVINWVIQHLLFTKTVKMLEGFFTLHYFISIKSDLFQHSEYIPA